MTEEPVASTPPVRPAFPAGANDMFRDPTKLSKWVAVLLWCFVGTAAIAFFLDFARDQFFQGVVAGAYSSRASIIETARIFDVVLGVIEVLYLGLWALTGFLFLKWVYRSNQSARGMGASDMAFTPGWAVGCYFVPFANLVLPFQAMTEIWNATLSPTEWKGRPAPQIVRWWWGLFLLNNVAGFVLGFQAAGTKTITAMIWLGRIAMLNQALTVVGAGVAAILVQRLCANQIKRWRVAEVFT